MWQTAKIAAVFIMAGLSMAGGIFSCVTVKCLVAKFGQSKTFQRTISILNCFTGGVFFATCILDILPEGRETMEEAKVHWGWDTEYPLSEILMGVGFFLILSVEQGAHTCFQLYTVAKDKIIEMGPENSATSSSEAKSSVSTISVRLTKLSQKSNDIDEIIVPDFEDHTCLGNVIYNIHDASEASLGSMSNRPDSITPEAKPIPDSGVVSEKGDKNVANQDAVACSCQHVTTSAALKTLEQSIDDNQHTIRGVMLLAALSLHMVFDGLAVGLLQNSSEIWNLVLALSLHKMLVFYTIGLQILELLKSLPKTISTICLFALVSPIGVVIGESITENGNESVQHSASAILQGLAAGTFIYVTFFEIFQREFKESVHDLCKVFVTGIGFSLTAAVKLLEN